MLFQRDAIRRTAYSLVVRLQQQIAQCRASLPAVDSDQILDRAIKNNLAAEIMAAIGAEAFEGLQLFVHHTPVSVHIPKGLL